MAKQNFSVARIETRTRATVGKFERHIERKNDSYFPDPNQRIFAITKSKLTHRFHKLSEEAGLRRITVHGLRHSHVSLLISKKYDIFEVSKRIGHKSIKTTQDIYGHLFDEVQKTIANDLDSLRRR